MSLFSEYRLFFSVHPSPSSSFPCVKVSFPVASIIIDDLWLGGGRVDHGSRVTVGPGHIGTHHGPHWLRPRINIRRTRLSASEI